MSTHEARLQEFRNLRTSPLDDAIERIERGAKLLDRHAPGWLHRVDLARLDMKSCESCMLAQLYGSYGEGQRVLGIARLGVATEFGFNGRSSPEFGQLTERWRTYIMIRRGLPA